MKDVTDNLILPIVVDISKSPTNSRICAKIGGTEGEGIVVYGDSISTTVFELGSKIQDLEDLSQEQKIYQYIKNKSNQANASYLAKLIGKATKYNWFELSWLEKHSFRIMGNKLSTTDIATQLNTLILFGNCTTKDDGDKGIKFKVIVKKIDMLTNVRKEIKEHENCIAQLKIQEAYLANNDSAETTNELVDENDEQSGIEGQPGLGDTVDQGDRSDIQDSGADNR